MNKIRFITGFYNSKTFLPIKKILYFIKLSRVNLWFIPFSVILSVSHTLVATYGVSLLFPLVQGILVQNFEHVRELRGISFLVNTFSQIFTTSSSLFIFLLFWIYIINIIKNIFSYCSLVVARNQSRISTARIRNILFEKFLKFGKSFYDKNKTAHLQDILINSASLIQTQIKIFQDLIARVFLMAAYLFIMFRISWKLMLISIVIFSLVIFISRKLTRNIIKLTGSQRKFTAILNDKIFNVLHCIPVIKSFGQEQKEIRLFDELSNREMEAGNKIEKLKGLIGPIDDIGIMTGNICIALAMAALIKYDSGLTAANAFVFYYLITRTVPGFNAISRFKLEAEQTSIALYEMEQILEQQLSYIIPGGSEPFTGLKDRIEFRNLNFNYTDGAQSVLKNVNFSVEKNSIVAIVGPSGSGKTTVVNLLLRLYDCEPAQLFIDGKDIRSYEIATLRRQIAVVSQDALLFNDTIRNNIVYGLDQPISDADLNSLMKTLNLESFIEKFPDKYETLVGEKGARLSGGERQRIAIARAAVRNAPILIMDEATSSLDSQTEADITEGVYKMATSRTVMIIAHRLSTIMQADKIIYLEKGSVAESGKWQELIDKKGLFYKQYIAQQI